MHINTIRSLRIRYIIGLSVIAVLVTASYLMIQHVISQQHFHSKLVNLAGHQSGLANRIAYFASLMALTNDEEEYTIARGQIGRTINRMRDVHTTLRKGNPDQNIPVISNDNLDTIYEDPTVGLDQAMEMFLEQAKVIYEHDIETFSIQSNAYIFLTTYGPHVLEPLLDAAVDEYEKIGTAAIYRIQKLERIIWIATLITLLFEIAFIFIPLESNVKKTLVSLEETIEELTQIRKRLLSAQKLALVGDWELNVQTNRFTWSEQVYNIFGVKQGEKTVEWDFFIKHIHQEDLDLVNKSIEKILSTGKSSKDEYRVLTDDGNERLVYQYATLKKDSQQNEPILSGTIQDITERKELSTRLEKLSEHVPGFIFQCHKDNQGLYKFTYASQGVKETCGIFPEYLLSDANHLFDLVHEDDIEKTRISMERSSSGLDTWHTKFRIKHPEKGIVWLEGHASPGRMVDASVLWYGYIWDITERKKSEDHIHKLALYDSLTGLGNRRLMKDRLNYSLGLSKKNKSWGALIMLDLDNFKTINDTHGHEMGDALLVEVASRLNTNTRETDTISRLGGDEFVIILEDLADTKIVAEEHAIQLAEKIRHSLNAPYYLDEGNVIHHGSSSLGVVVFKDTATSQSTLLKRADVAMYEAKEKGRNTVCLYSEERLKEIKDKNTLTQQLQLAVKYQELSLHFQPQVDNSGNICSAEALIRWIPEKGDPISPGEFIPLAENSGLILSIGEWVIEEACQNLLILLDKGVDESFSLAVNISPHQFRDHRFIETTRKTIEKFGVNPKQLKFEITESSLVHDFHHVNTMISELREIGLRVELDDFGTGYSSLNSLYNLPINALKIDRSLVSNIEGENPSKDIIKAVIAMAKAMSMEVIAEGVETTAQSEFLKREGVSCQQGFLFSKALPLEGFVTLYNS